MNARTIRTTFALITGLAASPSHAQLEFTTEHGIEFSTIGDPGNPAYQDGPDDPLIEGFLHNSINGRGSVPYRYRMSTSEIDTADYLAFYNTFSTQSDALNSLLRPGTTGFTLDPFYSGPGDRYRLRETLPDAAAAPISISWRQAAMLTNWLHNDRSSDPSAIRNGAYDVSTFTRNDDGSFNDQPTRHPDAKFWIPNLDEYIKAVHYDPDKGGRGPGWWAFPHSSDEPAVSGLPGEGETIRGVTQEAFRAFFDNDLLTSSGLPNGLYPDTQSPWGLIDVLGGEIEYIEDYFDSDVLAPLGQRFRSYKGLDNNFIEFGATPSYPAGLDLNELPWLFNHVSPTSRLGSFRIAAAVPAPGGACGAFVFALYSLRRKREW